MPSSPTLPTIIFQNGTTHLLAASILFANFTSKPITKIAVCKYDMASFEDVVNEGYVNREFEMVLPKQYIVIDELTSFCLEFVCHYTITFCINATETKEIKFKLDKYGKFESLIDNIYFDDLGVRGSVIRTFQIR